MMSSGKLSPFSDAFDGKSVYGRARSPLRAVFERGHALPTSRRAGDCAPYLEIHGEGECRHGIQSRLKAGLQTQAITRCTLLALAVLIAAAFSGRAQPTNTTGFASFQIVSQRNIFNPSRTARSRSSSTRSGESAADAFSFVGMLSYARGDFAFFDGTAPEYRKALKPNSNTNNDIAIFKVTALTPNSVTLAAGTNVTVLQLGMQMSRDDNGHWTVSTGSSDSGSGRKYSNRRRNFTYNASLNGSGTAADDSQSGDTNSAASDDTASSGTDNNPPDAAPAPAGGAGNDPLAQLMQRRAQEEQQLGQGQ